MVVNAYRCPAVKPIVNVRKSMAAIIANTIAVLDIASTRESVAWTTSRMEPFADVHHNGRVNVVKLPYPFVWTVVTTVPLVLCATPKWRVVYVRADFMATNVNTVPI